MALIKRCPGCSSEHPPRTLRCGCGVLLAGVDLTPAAAPDALEANAPAPTSAATRVCVHPDCAQPNPIEAPRCVYCDREFASVRLAWPWGEETFAGELFVGRIEPAAPALIARLEADYDNVSRRHALLRHNTEGLTIEDLGSVNGTFVDEVRLAPLQPVRLHPGARLRFAATLVVTVAEVV